MKITLIGPTYPFRGGIAHYTTLLTHHLRQRHDVRLISYIKQYPTSSSIQSGSIPATRQWIPAPTKARCVWSATGC